MPSNKKMGESMRKIGISEEIITKIDCTDQKGNRPGRKHNRSDRELYPGRR